MKGHRWTVSILFVTKSPAIILVGRMCSTVLVVRQSLESAEDVLYASWASPWEKPGYPLCFVSWVRTVGIDRRET